MNLDLAACDDGRPLVGWWLLCVAGFSWFSREVFF